MLEKVYDNLDENENSGSFRDKKDATVKKKNFTNVVEKRYYTIFFYLFDIREK